MRVSRKEDKMWHFTEPDHCGWAQTFSEENSFEETIEISSIEEIGGFCGMCRERREE